MRRRFWEPVDPNPTPEEKLLAEEEAAAQEALAAPLRARAAALKQGCMRLNRHDKGLLAAFLMDERVRRPWPAMSSAEVGELVGHTKIWVRVRKLYARRKHPCGGSPTACGRDRSACAHERGRKTFYTALVRSFNDPVEN